MLHQFGSLVYNIGMLSGLVAESRFADIGGAFIRDDIGFFGYKAGERGQLAELIADEHFMLGLECYIRCNGAEVCVAASLAPSVDCSLNMYAAVINRQYRICDRCAAVVVEVDAQGGKFGCRQTAP